MKSTSKSFLYEVIFIVTSVFPLALSMSVCSGMGVFAGMFFSVAAALIAAVNSSSAMIPVYLVFLTVSAVLGAYNAATLSLSIIISGALLALSSLFFEKIKPLFSSPASAGAMLAAALSVTILFTTDYFGIGASGNNVIQMLASYRSLGFHANWRGVLYGTIVMVIMITFPRKFKKLCSAVNASFIAIIVTLVLNLFLNPADMPTAINEIGNFSSADFAKDFIFALIGEKPNIFAAVFSGAALFFPCFYMIAQSETAEKRSFIIDGAANAALGFAGCMALPCGLKKDKHTFAVGTAAAAITAIMLVCISGLIPRIPVHSCAVVLIVGAWHSVKWREIKNAFSSVFSVLIFAVSILAFLIYGISSGILVCAALSALYHLISDKKPVKGS